MYVQPGSVRHSSNLITTSKTTQCTGSPHSSTQQRNFDLQKKGYKTILFNRSEIFHKNSRCTFSDYKGTEEILGELKVEPVEEKLRRYKSNLLRHETRTNNRMRKIMLNYRPNGRRRLRRTLTRQLDGAKTGPSRPYLRQTMLKMTMSMLATPNSPHDY